MHIHVENLINEEGKRKAHKIPEAALFTLCWGKMELLWFAKPCAKCYRTSASQNPWEACTFIIPVLAVRRVRHREVKEGGLVTQNMQELGFPAGRQASEPTLVSPPGS